MLRTMIEHSLRRNAGYASDYTLGAANAQNCSRERRGNSNRQSNLKRFLRKEIMPSSCILPKQLDKALRSTER